MSDSYSLSNTGTFTVTHAKYIASKVATDLKRIQRFYGLPSDSTITKYEIELIELLKKGYLGTVSYGFQKNGKWIEPTLRYTARELSNLMSVTDDDPGKIRPGANIEGATFNTYLTYSAAWDKLTDAEKHSFKKTLPYYRSGANEPEINGSLVSDKTYSSGGKALDRSIVKGN